MPQCHLTVDQESFERFRKELVRTFELVEQFAQAVVDAFAKAAVPFSLFAEKLQEVQMGRESDYSRRPTPRDLLRLAAHNNIIAMHHDAWHNGTMSWEEMLLSLSVRLGEALLRIQSGEYRRLGNARAESFNEFVTKYFGDAKEVASPAALDALARAGLVPGEQAVPAAEERRMAVMIIEPGPGGKTRIGWQGEEMMSYPGHLSGFEAVKRFCADMSIDPERAEIRIGAQERGGFPVSIAERPRGRKFNIAPRELWRGKLADLASSPAHPAEFAFVDDPEVPTSPTQQSERDRLVALRAKLVDAAHEGQPREQTLAMMDADIALRDSPNRPRNCAGCRGTGVVKCAGFEEACADCGGSGNVH